MNSKQIQQIKEAIKYWAKQHPNPDEVVLQLANGYEYTPRQIADEVNKDTEFGKLQLRVIEHALKEHKLEEILNGFYATQKTHLI